MIFKNRLNFSSGCVDWVIVGLGNPGRRYENTRHNVGFLVLDLLSDKWGIPTKKLKFQSLFGMGHGAGVRVLLLRPQTYMNRSGEAVRDCLRFYKVPPERTLVIYDDASLPTGKLRIREKGSDGGHNGLKSILYQLQTDVFPRVKIGIGSPRGAVGASGTHGAPGTVSASGASGGLVGWVLGGFSPEEGPIIRDALEKACGATEEIITRGAVYAMDRYN
ncbi:MAG: aminoacyl-tRNA hydrolase [Oscillospiraceae bacterium]|nr:aminoacyl-tRNA hydrolase [Oscillospiraceae bacterium]